jgi:hypothetical protein
MDYRVAFSSPTHLTLVTLRSTSQRRGLSAYQEIKEIGFGFISVWLAFHQRLKNPRTIAKSPNGG